MDGRCETCKWWVLPDEEDMIEWDERHGQRFRICDRIKMVEDHRPVPDGESVLVLAEGGSFAQIRPAAEFGCVLWEAKGDGE